MGNATSTDKAASAPGTENQVPSSSPQRASPAKPTANSPDAGSSNKRADKDEGLTATMRRQKMRIYEKPKEDSGNVKELPVLTELQSKIINTTLSHLFYSSNQPLSQSNLEFLLRRMSREQFPKDKRVVTKGEQGDLLYIIEEGELQISIGEKKIRVLESGNLFGELALIMNAPRGATVDSITEGYYWTLHRDDFKCMQRMLSTEITAKYAKMFERIPFVSTCLDPADLGLLMHNLSPATYQLDEKVYQQNMQADRVVVIDEGVAEIRYLPPFTGATEDDFSYKTVTVEQLEKKYGIYGAKTVNASGETENSVQIVDEPGTKNSTNRTVLLKHGTIIVGPLWAHAMLCDGWQEKDASTVQISKDNEGHYAKGTHGKVMPYAPFSILPHEDFIRCSYFTLGLFESKLGKIESVFKVETDDEGNIVAKSKETSPTRDGAGAKLMKSGSMKSMTSVVPGRIIYRRDFTADTFASFKFQGGFSLGFIGVAETVVNAEYSEKQTFFLKVVSKNRAVAKNQANAAVNECKIISSLDNPFIVQLIGKFATPDHLITVLEYVSPPESDLFAQIYSRENMEKSKRVETKGMSDAAVKFYTANILLALAHMHARKISFRNLKPENCMIDQDGYIKIVGYGFAKRIPFKLVGVLQYKSYTLCGTPEYLAPELLLNMGHDHQVDMWALGILVYEMCVLSTPFKSAKDDVVETISRITAVRKKKVHFHHQLDRRSHNLRDFVFKCLQYSSAARLNVLKPDFEGSAFSHDYFDGFDWHSMAYRKHDGVPHVPNFADLSFGDQLSTRLEGDKFTGDPSLVQLFTAF